MQRESVEQDSFLLANKLRNSEVNTTEINVFARSGSRRTNNDNMVVPETVIEENAQRIKKNA